MMRPVFLAAPLLLALVSPVLWAQDAKPAMTLRAVSDYLALHATGTAPEDASLAYRFAESGSIAADAPWTPVTARPGPGGAFAFDLPLPKSRWSELEVRAMQGDKEAGKKMARAKQPTFEWLTPESVAALPEPERAAWTAYLERSRQRREAEFDAIAAECRALGLAESKPAPQDGAQFEVDSDTPASWFAREDMVSLAKNLISYQTPTGGWSKAVGFAKGARQPGMHWTSQQGNPWHYCGTIDNRATTEPVKFLAGVFSATGDPAAKAALQRGLEYLFEAQFPNGGWPQNYPVEPGYHEAVTLNDNAMVHVMELMLLIAEGRPPFAFADETLRARARTAFDRGLACLAAMQVRIGGRPTVWCAQHHPLTLEPVHARTKEPPSLSGGESAEVVRFLMRQAPVNAAVTAMIEPALDWFREHRLTGLRKAKTPEGKTDYVEDPDSKEVYWARFYDLETGKAIFPGAQDGILYPTFREMAAKNKVAYDFIVTRPGEILEKELPRWKKRVAKGK